MLRQLLKAAFLLIGAAGAVRIDASVQTTALRSALTFHAPFDGSVDASHALGNPKLYTAPSLARRAEAIAGLPAGGETVQAKDAGRFGDALKFNQRRKPVVFFEAGRN